MIGSVVLVALLATSARPQNACHRDCAAFQCHGPTAGQCGACTGNRETVGGQCACRPGYFDSPTAGRCGVAAWDCAAGVVQSDGSVACSRCYHNR